MKVAITGYNGNIGRRLVSLLSRCDVEIVKVGRQVCSDCKIDILNLPAKVKNLPFVDCIVHLAWYTKHPEFWDSPLNNQLATNSLRLLHEFRNINPNVHAVISGSCAEIFSNSNSITELGNAKTRLRTNLEDQHKFDLTWFQIFFAYGPGEPQTKILSVIKENENLQSTIKNPSAVCDFIHFDHVALAFKQAIFAKKFGCYQLGSTLGLSIDDLIRFRLNGNIPKEYTFSDVINSRDITDYKIADPQNNWPTGASTSQVLEWITQP